MNNIITIEKGVPVPTLKHYASRVRYKFIEGMDIGDSFVINGNTPDISTIAMRSHCYGRNGIYEKALSKSPNREISLHKYAIRTLSGKSVNPNAIRVWRIK